MGSWDYFRLLCDCYWYYKRWIKLFKFLRDSIRSGASREELLEIIQNAVGKKKRQHAGE